MIRPRIIALAAAAALVLSSAAWAQQAFTSRTANVRAGPARDFPLIATLPPGASVYVQGCLTDYRWCDIDFGGGRGWISTRSLQSDYGGSVVPLYGYGATLGLPIITFSLLNYWDSYYRDRPFYRERPRWDSHWRDLDRRPRYDNRPRPDYRAPDRRPDYRPDRRPDYRPGQPRVEGPRPQQPFVQPPRNRPEGRPQGPQVQPRTDRPAPPPRVQGSGGMGRTSGRDNDPGREHQGQ